MLQIPVGKQDNLRCSLASTADPEALRLARASTRSEAEPAREPPAVGSPREMKDDGEELLTKDLFDGYASRETSSQASVEISGEEKEKFVSESPTSRLST